MIRVHPGKILADEMRARALTANALALKLHVPANRSQRLLMGSAASHRRQQSGSGIVSAPEQASGFGYRLTTIWRRSRKNLGPRSAAK
jgi:hypothetical protein